MSLVMISPNLCCTSIYNDEVIYEYMRDTVNTYTTNITCITSETDYADYKPYHSNLVMPNNISYNMKDRKHVINFNCNLGSLSNKWVRSLNIYGVKADGKQVPYVYAVEDRETHRGKIDIPHILLDTNGGYVDNTLGPILAKQLECVLNEYKSSQDQKCFYIYMLEKMKPEVRVRTILTLIASTHVRSGK